VRLGDAGDSEAAEAGSRLNALRAEYDGGLPLTDVEIDDLFESLSGAIGEVHQAEVQAHQALAEVVGR
jgi:hypothetical protein